MAANPNGHGDGQARRTLEDYSTFSGPLHFNSISRPRVNAANMEIKPALIHLVQNNQFQGLSHENPYNHLATFIEICNTVKIHDVPDEAIRLSLFPFSLVGNAKVWLNSFPENSFTAWEDVVAKFLNKYFPQSKVNKGKQEISSFQQDGSETLSQAWDRFKGLLRRTPTHGPDNKMILDAAAGGTMMSVDAEQATRIIEALASTHHQAQHNRQTVQRKGILDLSTTDAILAQNKILTQQMEALTKQMANLPEQLKAVQSPPSQQPMRCNFCGGDHPNGHCSYQSSSQEGEVQYVSNQGRSGNFSNNNNFSQGWRNNQSQNFGWKQDDGPSNRQPPYQHQQQNPSVYERTTKLEDTLEKFMQASMTNQKNTEASIRNLETQVGQLAKQLSDQQAGHFSATQTNPKEHCKSITTRSGTIVGRGIGDNLVVEEEINIPFVEAMEQMPTYAKFMKELLTKKRRFSDETVELEAGCSAIIQKSLPQKSKDPGSFTIPVTIGTLAVGKALLDLGASINLMPLSMLRRIGDLEVRPTRMTLQLVDRSLKYPYGVAEDVLVKVDKFMFPVDFVVMDIEEDVEVPLILGRPFMKTAKVIIDVDDGKLKVRVQDDEVNFNVFEAIQHPNDKQQCFKMDVVDEICLVARKQLAKASPLEISTLSLLVAPVRCRSSLSAAVSSLFVAVNCNFKFFNLVAILVSVRYRLSPSAVVRRHCSVWRPLNLVRLFTRQPTTLVGSPDSPPRSVTRHLFARCE
ncbi:uncharacterized protein LOC128196651 [Vigna angularis]|uniref:uncharacterized protein LOC128196651 n=1 Tax=Phaseolus angularis TaxID=3914 RepID=UPI0022B5C950|nr:uncharacterized protein LOC128196651 [Vigna angularis]